MNLKQQKLEQKKASEISGDTRAWNIFYMRQDTVWFYLNFCIANFFFVSIRAKDCVLPLVPNNID
jgi:hypothetical protein